MEADDATPGPSGSQTHLPPISTTTPPSTKTTHRKRLQPEALLMLEDYFTQVNQNPNPSDREALLKKIKEVPGCMHYDIGRMANWFGSRRKRLRMKERKEQAPNDTNNDSRFPSLTPAAIQHLTVLASNQLHPSPELLKTWTTLLASSGAVEQDVINWIHHRNQQEQSPQLTSTPSDTTNMTPELSVISPISPISPISQFQTKSTTLTSPTSIQEMIASPVALPLAYPHEHDNARATPSEPLTTSPISNNELNQCIIHGVRDALASSQTKSGLPSSAAPKTAAEFKALFSPFEQKISLLLHTLESTSRIGTPIDQQ